MLKPWVVHRVWTSSVRICGSRDMERNVRRWTALTRDHNHCVMNSATTHPQSTPPHWHIFHVLIIVWYRHWQVNRWYKVLQLMHIRATQHMNCADLFHQTTATFKSNHLLFMHVKHIYNTAIKTKTSVICIKHIEVKTQRNRIMRQYNQTGIDWYEWQ